MKKYYLNKFINAQDLVYKKVLEELKKGKKTTHWMWYIFPQIYGLGTSRINQYYSINSIDEAREYLNNATLNSRLRECCKILLDLDTYNSAEIFGNDWIKLGSSMTLFDYVSPNDIFKKVIDKYFSGYRDPKTLSIIRK